MGINLNDTKLVTIPSQRLTVYHCYCDKCGVSRGYRSKKEADRVCGLCARTSDKIRAMRTESAYRNGFNKLMLGKKQTDKQKESVRIANSGSNSYNWKGGIKNPGICLDCSGATCDGHSKRCAKCAMHYRKGSLNPNYKGEHGITKLSLYIRSLKWYKDWVKAVLERDNYTCQYTGVKGGSLHVHHDSKEFHEILAEIIILHKDSRIAIIEAMRLIHLDLSIGKTVQSQYHIRVIHSSNGHIMRRAG